MTDDKPESLSKAERLLRKKLPEGIEQRGMAFHHPDHGLLRSFEESVYEEGPDWTPQARMEARKRFTSWWLHTKERIQELKDGPEGIRRLYQHYLDPDNPLPDSKDEWPPGWAD